MYTNKWTNINGQKRNDFGKRENAFITIQIIYTNKWRNGQKKK